MKPLQNLAATLLLAGLGLPASAAVVATLDSDRVQPGESVQLSLTRDGGGGDPDLAPLKQDFDVLGTSSGSNISVTNGHVERRTEVRITLSPKRSGSLAIPPLSWGGERSTALTLTVAASAAGQSAAPGGSSPHVFLTATLDQPRPYLQSSTLLTVQVHTDLPLNQAGLELAGDSDLLVQQIGKDKQSREMRNGHAYDVVERQYLLQPQRSGTLSLPGVTLEAQVPDTGGRGRLENDPFFGGLMSRTRPIRLHGETIQLEVRPRPEQAAGPVWLPAKKVTLERSLKPESGSMKAGEPLTLHLSMTAQGLTGEQLPDLGSRLSLPEGFRAYPDQAKLDTRLEGGEVSGSREQDIALIASKPGRYRLPEQRLQWWDTGADVPREIVIPERTIEVLPVEGGATVPAPPSTLEPEVAKAVEASAPPPKAAAGALAPGIGSDGGGRRSPWLWTSLALSLLWLATLLAWWRQRRAAPPGGLSTAEKPAIAKPDASAARKAFQQACRGNDPLAARRQLLAWSRAVHGDAAAAGPNALAEALNQPRLTELLRQLDRACFSGGDWQGEVLARELDALPAVKPVGIHKPVLAPLYP